MEVFLGGSFAVKASYDTRRKIAANAPAAYVGEAAASLGVLWETDVHRRLIVQAANGRVVVQASRGANAWVSFVASSGAYVADADISDRLIPEGSGWRYIDEAAMSQELYDSAGVLTSLQRADGATLSFIYSTGSEAPAPGLLLSIVDQHGRSISFTYEQPADAGWTSRITTMTGAGGEQTLFGYDGNGNLTQITWPDGKVRRYLYENFAFKWALTGVIDENGKRTATIGYDAYGRADDTQRAGGVERYRTQWAIPPSWQIAETYDAAANVIWRDHRWATPMGTTVTLPNGFSSSLAIADVLGMPRLAGQSQPAGSGCEASSNNQAYDRNGNITQRDDFNGNRVCYGNDLSRNLEVARVEGLGTSEVCSSILPASTLPAGSRKVSTQWHPDWRLATRVAEPGRMTTSVYNGQFDPFSGGLLTCAGAGVTLPKLPDGKPLALLCKQVEQATTDASGVMGFGAELQAGVPAREQKWTYNQYGQILTHDGPRTDITDVTTYAYYSDTSFSGASLHAAGHTLGDLKIVTNAVGNSTHYTLYEKGGKLLEMIDSNNVDIRHNYDARQRLLGTTVGGRTTSYVYDSVGQLKKLILPDDTWSGYDYDDAHRLVTVYDHVGNRITYTLDNAGNRVAEAATDPTGALRRQLSRSFDALGRVQQTVGQ